MLTKGRLPDDCYFSIRVFLNDIVHISKLRKTDF
jgi:hypothetical protein